MSPPTRPVTRLTVKSAREMPYRGRKSPSQEHCHGTPGPFHASTDVERSTAWCPGPDGCEEHCAVGHQMPRAATKDTLRSLRTPLTSSALKGQSVETQSSSGPPQNRSQSRKSAAGSQEMLSLSLFFRNSRAQFSYRSDATSQDCEGHGNRELFPLVH